MRFESWTCGGVVVVHNLGNDVVKNIPEDIIHGEHHPTHKPNRPNKDKW